MGTFRMTWISTMFLKPPLCQFMMSHAATSYQEEKPIKLWAISYHLRQSKNQWSPEASLRPSKLEPVHTQVSYQNSNYQLCLTDGEPSSTEVDYYMDFKDVVDVVAPYSAPEKFKFRSIDNYVQQIIDQQKKEPVVVYPVMREPCTSVYCSFWDIARNSQFTIAWWTYRYNGRSYAPESPKAEGEEVTHGSTRSREDGHMAPKRPHNCRVKSGGMLTTSSAPWFTLHAPSNKAIE